ARAGAAPAPRRARRRARSRHGAQQPRAPRRSGRPPGLPAHPRRSSRGDAPRGPARGHEPVPGRHPPALPPALPMAPRARDDAPVAPRPARGRPRPEQPPGPAGRGGGHTRAPGEPPPTAPRGFSPRQLLRIASRDILGDADLTVTTEELSHLADVALDA